MVDAMQTAQSSESFCFTTGLQLTAKAKRSPLIQGGLEIPIKVNVQWTHSRNLAVLKQRTEKVSYPIETDYTDDSR